MTGKLTATSGIVFVLALDHSQLAHSVRTLYGDQFDTQGYLRRFFSLNYILRKPQAIDFTELLCKNFDFDGVLVQRENAGHTCDRKHITETFPVIADALSLPLRDMEQSFARLVVILSVTDPRTHLAPIFLTTLLLLRTGAEETYRRYIQREAGHEEVIRLIERTPTGRHFMAENYGLALHTYLETGFYTSDQTNERASQLPPQSTSYFGDKPYTYEHALADTIRELSQHRQGRGFAADLYEKIEFAQSFTR